MSDEERFPIARAEVCCSSSRFSVGRVLNQIQSRPAAHCAIHGVAGLWGLHCPLCHRHLDSSLQGEEAEQVHPQQNAVRYVHNYVGIISSGTSIPRSSTARRSLDSLQHLALDVDRAIQAFVVNGGAPGGTEMFYQTLSNPTEVAKNVIYITMTLVGDTFVTYRLFVVWNHSWLIIVLPVTMLLATAGAPPPAFRPRPY